MSQASSETSIEIEPADVAVWLSQEPAPEVIDVRETYEREAGHIEGSRHVSLNELTGAAASVPRDRPVVFYCRVGARSQMAAQAFRTAGFDAYTMSGGLLRWAAEGRPLIPDGGHVADH
ncbi:MAG TPA: rhodanese-like domain-containing protein [Solirubrobacteraceae bacterium]|jgi:hydroxyacylglutathione hydrolase/adenylyltransferase/sulfurtransferase|nr:rhodanese-like domain-containing protein [Solirubrobacteraceae bacterium]